MDTPFVVQTMTDVLYFATWYGGMIVCCVGLIAFALGIVYKSGHAFCTGIILVLAGSIPLIRGLQLMGLI